MMPKVAMQTPRVTIRKALKNTMNSMTAIKKLWKKHTTPPLSRKDVKKTRYFEAHKHELPANVLQVLHESNRCDTNRLINHLVVPKITGKMRFRLDAPYLRESLRA